jgi:hypothetical protein
MLRFFFGVFMSSIQYGWSGVIAICAVGALVGSAHASCGQAFCVVNTNWAMQGIPSDPGSSRLDLRFESINQTNLRQGNHSISAADDTEDPLERHTSNRNLIATYDYTFSNDWGFTFAAPVQKRIHEHTVDPAGIPVDEQWNFTRIGDIRALANYSIVSDDDPLNRYGFQFGFKLPTGNYKVGNSDGVKAERSLQPGSGSTDVIVSAFYTHRGFTTDAAWFAQLGYQQAALTQDNYRPGSQVGFTAGYNQPLVGALTGTLQLNALLKSRDSGANAEWDLSGGRYVFISPGLSYAVSNAVQLYAYAQLPIYRYVNGIQLVADRGFVGGAAFQF